MSNKIISILLAIGMLFPVVCIAVSAQENTTTCFSYEIIDGKITITGCDDTVSSKIVIPNSIDGYPVTEIGDSAFFNRSGFEGLIISDGITKIGDYSFCHTELSDIEIPDSVTSIGDGAFQYCYQLKSINIPGSVTTIGNWAFYECSLLESVTINSDTEIIGTGAFGSCPALKSITIPNSVTDIGEDSLGYQYDKDIWENVLIEGFIIYGVRGSAADKYARKNGIKFIIKKLEEITTEEISSEQFEPVSTETTTEEVSSDQFESVSTETTTEEFSSDQFEPVSTEKTTEEVSSDQFEPASTETTTEEVSSEQFEPVSQEVFSTEAESISDMTTTEQISVEFETETENTSEQQESEPTSEDSSESVKTEKDEYLVLEANMNISDIQSLLKNENAEAYLPDGSLQTTNAFVGTGCFIKCGSTKYTVIVLCDVDGNGTINAADARLTLRVSAQLDIFEGCYLTAANVDGDNKITAADARKILRVSAKLESI